MTRQPKTPAKRSSRLRDEKRTPLSPSLSHGMSNLSLGGESPSKTESKRGKSKSKSKSTYKTKTIDMTVKTKLGDGDDSNPFIDRSDIPRARTYSHSLSQSSYDFRAALDLSGSRSRPTTPARSITQSGEFIVTDALRREASGGLLTRKEAQPQLDFMKKDFVPPPRKKVTRSKSQPAVGMVRTLSFLYRQFSHSSSFCSVIECFPASWGLYTIQLIDSLPTAPSKTTMQLSSLCISASSLLPLGTRLGS